MGKLNCPHIALARAEVGAQDWSMPQLQLPIFPAGTTPITPQLAFDCQDGKVTYLNGHLPVFQHAQDDLAAFRAVHQPVSSQRDGEPSGGRASFSRAAEDGEAIRETVSGGRCEELFRDAAEAIGIGAEGRGKRASASPLG